MTNISYLKAQLPLANAISITTATATNVIAPAQTNVTTTNPTGSGITFVNAGWWRVYGFLYVLGNTGTTITRIAGCINTVSATLLTADTGLTDYALTSFTTAGTEVIPLGANIINVGAQGAALYLVAQTAFGTSTMTVAGTLYAEQIAD